MQSSDTFVEEMKMGQLDVYFFLHPLSTPEGQAAAVIYFIPSHRYFSPLWNVPSVVKSSDTGVRAPGFIFWLSHELSIFALRWFPRCRWGLQEDVGGCP
jgi:hypothetical protein